MIVGTKDFIFHCKRLRKALGGGMRQAGVIAAAAIISLTSMIDRLSIDHSNAQQLAKGLSTLDGLDVKADEVETNIVYVRVNEGGFGAARGGGAARAEGAWGVGGRDGCQCDTVCGAL